MATAPEAKSRGPVYVLGIDIGTTTVKVCLLNEQNGTVAESLSRETKASMPSELGPLGSEQDVHKICTALQFCVSRLHKDSLARVSRIGVSGQMHGCMLWKEGESWHQNNFGRYEVENVSCLYTWQDGRCTSDFLASLPKPDSHLHVSTGCGCATLFWLQRNQPDLISQYKKAGTVQDFVVAMLCGLNTPVMSVQNAASWGFYDTNTSSWNTDRLKEAGFPLHFLPDVVPAGNIAGHTTSTWYGIPEGTPVLAALGDLQCSVLSTMENEHDAVLNISTSAQLSFIMPEGFCPPKTDSSSPIAYFPYFEGRYLAVAASLNGGNVLAAFVKLLQQWTHELGLGVPESKIWERLQATALDESTVDTDMVVNPTIYGERHLPDKRASVLQIDPTNLTLGKVTRAVCRGLISNLHSMLGRDQLLESHVSRIVGSGTALTKNAVLQQEVERHYDLPIVYGAGSDAAVGVAQAVLKYS